MKEYEKIKNLYLFDEKTKGRRAEFTCPEFGFLSECMWRFTEKIDGMNLRLIYGPGGEFEIRGRTDRAQLPGDLVKTIMDHYSVLPFTNMILFGEGYGGNIQKGSCYGPKKDFILFDIYRPFGNYYFEWDVLADIAAEHRIPVTPVLLSGTLDDAYQAVKKGLGSAFGDFIAEGVVGKPMVPLLTGSGERIIVKIKARDYYGKELVSENS